jgi:uncharacterized protein (TIGR03643 family)
MNFPDDLSEEDISHVIGMAWKDDVPFEAIEARYGLDEEAVITLMRRRLKRSSWTLWRERVQNRPTKHAERHTLTDSVSRRPPGARSIEPVYPSSEPDASLRDGLGAPSETDRAASGDEAS